MRVTDAVLFQAYRRTLILYPQGFRIQYQEQMLLTLRDACRERRSGATRFWLNVCKDLVKSVCVERMFVKRQPVFIYAVSVALVLTLVGWAAAITIQQMLRRGADQPQVEMVNWYASEIEAGVTPDEAIPPGYVDLERSLQPFVIFYDDRGSPEKGTGYLDQSMPAPPAGVFENVRNHGSEKFTWQPSRQVRIATVVRRVTGAHPGFMLSGRSLRVVEEDESLLRRMVIFGWLAMVLVLALGATLLGRAQSAPHVTSQT